MEHKITEHYHPCFSLASTSYVLLFRVYSVPSLPHSQKEKKNILQAYKVLFLSSLQNASQLNPIL